jgi:methylenetetrahydrofolate reductase (NADPH)
VETCRHQRRYFVELLTPKQNTEDLEKDLQIFADKYRQILDLGHVVSITDNPMGILSFQATDMIGELGLPVPPEGVLMHLNTCHTREHLDEVLSKAHGLGITCLLVVTGDGSPRLPKLTPESLGVPTQSVTSVELLEYIRGTYADKFNCGVAFNPYEPQDHELEKMRRKLAAGARFIITQPVFGRDERVQALLQFGVPVIMGAWMSKKLGLLSDCVGYALPQDETYDPIANLRKLHASCKECGLYLSLVGLKTQLPLIRDVLSN